MRLTTAEERNATADAVARACAVDGHIQSGHAVGAAYGGRKDAADYEEGVIGTLTALLTRVQFKPREVITFKPNKKMSLWSVMKNCIGKVCAAGMGGGLTAGRTCPRSRCPCTSTSPSRSRR